MSLAWKTNERYRLEETLITWQDPTTAAPRRCRIWITERPRYCDRGRYLAQTDAPLDWAEGWPRYYFNLECAKAEIELWVRGRREIPK